MTPKEEREHLRRMENADAEVVRMIDGYQDRPPIGWHFEPGVYENTHTLVYDVVQNNALRQKRMELVYKHDSAKLAHVAADAAGLLVLSPAALRETLEEAYLSGWFDRADGEQRRAIPRAVELLSSLTTPQEPQQ